MKIIRKVAFIYLMAMMVGVFASLQPGPPGDPNTPPDACLECEDFPEGSPEYNDCLFDCQNPQAPIDDSILYLLIAGTLLASFVLLKKPNHKKTPM